MSLCQQGQLAPALSMTNVKCEMIYGKCSDTRYVVRHFVNQSTTRPITHFK